MNLDLTEVEAVCKDLYVRALKLLPPDIKAGFADLARDETSATGRAILGTMVENIAVAERTKNILCQDTGIPIYNVVIGRGVRFEGADLKAAIRRGCARATTEHSLRSSVVHPITRVNEQTSCGIRVPIIHVDFDDRAETVAIEMIPKGSGSENGSFLQMLLPSDGINAVKRFVIDRVIELGGRVCPPTIVGWASAAPPISACISPRSRPPASFAPPAPTRRARGSRRSCRGPSTNSASARRGSAGAPRASPSTWRSPPRTSPRTRWR